METHLHPVPERVAAGSTSPIADLDAYRSTYAAAQADPSGFWLAETRRRIAWRTPPTAGLQGGYPSVEDGPFRWFADGTLNVTESCLDRHLAQRPDKPAIIWESDEPGQGRTITYAELHAEVCQAAGALRELGVRKGDRVIIYMGMVPEAAVAMLACARLGAVHSVVFGGFSADSLRDRIDDCEAKVVITQDLGRRGGRDVALKAVVDEALDAGPHSIERVLVYQRTDRPLPMTAGRDVWWHDVVPTMPTALVAEELAAEDPLFILYTSGSTGTPKGLVHTCGGYITYTSYTHEVVFDLREDDVYACVADVGWITGHSYIVYGPLANGATSVMFESVPTYPDPGRYWDLVARHGVTIFYTAPTAIRAIAALGDDHVTKHDRSSLRVLGTVGEPINPDAWHWYNDVVGQGRCNIVDTWWQTETGGICISPIANATPTTPTSATLPLPGILPALLDDADRTLVGPAQGRLFMTHPWPGQARTVWGDHERYLDTYFRTVEGLYFTGDGCARDERGYHFITGRVDDVLNVAGHRVGTAEFESVLAAHAVVAESAVVGYPHEIKGQGVYAYVVLEPGAAASGDLEDELNALVRKAIGAHAKVDIFQFVPGLPKTRSGKCMRRILRKVAEGLPDQLGDISTLADPSVVDAIKAGAKV